VAGNEVGSGVVGSGMAVDGMAVGGCDGGVGVSSEEKQEVKEEEKEVEEEERISKHSSSSLGTVVVESVRCFPSSLVSMVVVHLSVFRPSSSLILRASFKEEKEDINEEKKEEVEEEKI
jgi:hypothetical protein